MASSQTGVIPETLQDDRLYVKEFVNGVELSDVVVAYPFSTLNEQPVVNDTVGDEAVLVVFDQEAAVSVAFSRVVDGQTLTFSETDERLVIQDNENRHDLGCSLRCSFRWLAGWLPINPPQRHHILLVWLEGYSSRHAGVWH